MFVLPFLFALPWNPKGKGKGRQERAVRKLTFFTAAINYLIGLQFLSLVGKIVSIQLSDVL